MSSGVLNENGDAPVLLLRGVCHSILPVALSSATTICLSLPSTLKMRYLPATIGEPPLPCVGAYLISCFAHTFAPSFALRQAVPMCPKWTYTLPSSTTGVGLAWLFFLCGVGADAPS